MFDIESYMQKGSVGIVAHDAGGANQLNSLMRHFENTKFLVYALGPAKKILTAGNAKHMDSSRHLFELADTVFFGTGSSDMEKNLLKDANELGLTTISILDHFTNYKDRFFHGGVSIYPDLCLVNDDYSLSLAKEELHPYKNIHISKNYYIDEIRQRIDKYFQKNSKAILYVMENIDEDWGGEQPWKISFRHFYDNLFLKNEEYTDIIVRPHPADDPLMYAELGSYKGVVFDKSLTAVDSLEKVSLVVGAESYLLYTAKLCGFTVYTSIPPSIRKPRLPDQVCKVISA